MCLAFAGALMACNAGNASAQTESQAEASAIESNASNEDNAGILSPKDDSQIRPGMKVERPTIIDFNATWCGPCRIFAPAFDKVAEEYGSKADFYSIDTDKYPQTASAFSIRAIPTIVFIMPDGTMQTHVGLSDFLTSLKNEDASQEEVVATMTAELQQMVADMTK